MLVVQGMGAKWAAWARRRVLSRQGLPVCVATPVGKGRGLRCYPKKLWLRVLRVVLSPGKGPWDPSVPSDDGKACREDSFACKLGGTGTLSVTLQPAL